MSSFISDILSNEYFNKTPIHKQITIGAGVSFVDLFINTGILAIAKRVFGLQAEQNGASKSLRELAQGKNFYVLAILYAPILEELIFRVTLPYILKILAEPLCLPQLNNSLLNKVSSALNISKASIITSIISGICFGILHSSNSPGKLIILIHSLVGIMLGLVKERYGFLTSLTAHTITNATVVYLVYLVKEENRHAIYAMSKFFGNNL